MDDNYIAFVSKVRWVRYNLLYSNVNVIDVRLVFSAKHKLDKKHIVCEMSQLWREISWRQRQSSSKMLDDKPRSQNKKHATRRNRLDTHTIAINFWYVERELHACVCMKATKDRIFLPFKCNTSTYFSLYRTFM